MKLRKIISIKCETKEILEKYREDFEVEAFDTAENLRLYLKEHQAETDQMLLVAATDRTILIGRDFGVAVLAYASPDFPQRTYRGVEMIVEGFEEVDADFLEKRYQRHHRLPWKILETERCIVRELALEDMDALFGPGYELTKIKDLKQPGQFACKETLTVCGPKGALEKVRVLGPLRKATQVEVLLGDSFKLGVKPPTRMSGDLGGTPGITLVGPKGSVQLAEGVIVAQRHIHMTAQEAAQYGVHDGQIVSMEFDGPRCGILGNVAIRAGEGHSLECHVDTEEANALAITSSTTFKLIK